MRPWILLFFAALFLSSACYATGQDLNQETSVVVHRRVLTMPCEVIEPGKLEMENGEPVVVSLAGSKTNPLYPGALSAPFGYVEYVPDQARSPLQMTLINKAKDAAFRLEPGRAWQDSTSKPVVRPDTTGGPESECDDVHRAVEIVNQRRLPRRIGHQIVGPRAIYTPDPKYTNAMRKAGIEGTVETKCVVTEAGRLIDIKIVHSLSPEADKNAIEALRKWKFEPARDGSRAIAIPVTIKVNFRLYHGG
jgi:TonB family protein